MAGLSYPFANEALTPTEWAQMARLWQRNGVVAGVSSELRVTVSGGAIISGGSLWLNGFLYYNTGTRSVSLIGGATTYINAVVDSVPDGIYFTGTNSPAPVNSNTQMTIAAVSSTGVVTDMRTWAGESYLPLIIGNGVTTIPTGRNKVAIPIPYDVKIKKWELIADVAGQLSVAVQSTTYDSWSSTAGNTMFNTSISAGKNKGSDRINTTVRAGTYIRPYVTSISSIKQATLSLLVAPIMVTGI